MMMTSRAANILTIPPGVAFLRELATGILDGRLAPGFRYDPEEPLSLSRVTVFLPTRRAARELRSEFVDLLGGRSAILPLIRPLGETEDDDGYFDAAEPALMDLAPPIGGTAQLIELARLILAWRNQLPEIVRSIHSDTPLVAPASPADAIWLARALVELIDAVETEERDWDLLGLLKADDFAGWWQLTLEFLKIASQFWPNRLSELNRSSPARHRNALLRAEANRLLNLKGAGPVIVAGSTGSIPAAAGLIAAIARCENGVVVLPGLDQAMPDAHWPLAGAELAGGPSGDPAGRGHPQYGLHQLLQRLGLGRDEVVELGAVPADLKDRAEVLSRAMAPAAATDEWIGWRTEFGPQRLAAAFADVSLIEAANEREEATTIAIALRLALEEPGAGDDSRVALVTPDRALARRVCAELARFGIVADDSAGTPLSATSQGTLLRLVLEASLGARDPLSIVSLLKHPLARFGFCEADYRAAAEALELMALRGGTAPARSAGLTDLLADQVKATAEDRHAPQWRLGLDPAALTSAALLAERLDGVIDLLSPATGTVHRSTAPIGDWAERSGRALEAICADDRGNLAPLWSGEAGEKLASLFEQIIETDGILEADGIQWIDIVQAFTAGEAVKPRAMRHPRVLILGTLEARLQTVDTLILGGLNEGSWPGQTTNNPFLSRMMKTEIGLEPPERRIGQLAHDFQMASGTRKLIYSRSARQGSAPTVASRWLQRLLALGGPDFAATLRGRGEVLRGHARLLDQGEDQRPAQRPAPKPELALQPRQFSFSEVGRLRRDPYAIYARRILRLDPVQPFITEPGPAERGTLYHRIAERFISEAQGTERAVREQDMARIIAECFADANLPLHIDVVWRHRFHDVVSSLLDWEMKRQGTFQRSLTEVPAGYEIANADIRLTGIADRIDIRPGGFADIIDYKTGSSPTDKQARSLLDPQLPLEAAALKAGAFRGIGSLIPADLIYVRLRPGDRFKEDTVNNELKEKGEKAKSAMDLGAEAIDQLVRFVELLRSGQRGYVSRLVPFMQGNFGGEFDHLARVAEWSTAENEEAGDD